MRTTQKKQLSALLLIGVLLIILSSFTLSVCASTTSSGSNLNGYIENIEILPFTTGDPIPNYSFQKETTQYNIDLYNGVMPMVKLSAEKNAVDGKNLYYYMVLDAGTDSETYALATDGLKKITNADVTKGMLNKIPKLSCGPHTLSIRVGKSNDGKTFDDVYDEYVYNFTLKPGFSTFDAKDKDNKSTLSPKYTSTTCYFNDIFSATTVDGTITFTGKFKSCGGNTVCYIGETQIMEGEGLTTSANGDVSLSKTVNLSDYADDGTLDEQYVYKIPFSLVYKSEDVELCSESTVYVVNSVSATPVITQQPENVICDKQEMPKFSITASGSSDAVTTYQWYSSTSTSDITFEPIEGATSSTYTLSKNDTSAAGTRYYRCKVTNTITIDGIGELPFSVTSDIASVKTNLTYINTPNILNPLGSFVSTEDNTYDSPYRLKYTSGEKFDLIYIGVEQPEAGVSLSYQYFINTDPDITTAKPIEVVYGQGKIDSNPVDKKTHIITCAQSIEGYETGVYYVFCTVTATADGLASVSETSGPVRLEYTQVELDGFAGSGTKSDPYQLKSEADLERLRTIVNVEGQWCPGVQFKMIEDIELSADWEPIGIKVDMTPEVTDEAKKTYTLILKSNKII